MGDAFDDEPTFESTDANLDGTSLLNGEWLLEPIAIIGLGCRYPGAASTPSKLWTELAAGTSAWSKGPPGERFNMAAFHDVKNAHSSTTNADGGHFLSEDISAFDATFFGIHGAEARAMDPQQRLLLEVAYESFENAGVTPDQLWESNTGVYAGQWTSDYSEVLARDTENQATYHVTGAGPAITSNRISYFFNLLGPSMTVDTGCSASLVALHLAVQSLRSGETEMSFVGGVNIFADPQRFTYQSKLKMLSDAGRSFPFDHRANGYGRGEGVAGLVLKPLSAALRDGDRVRAIIRNTVLNQDGRTPGITVPSGEAQERAIRRAYKEAGLDLHADYVEAHGTGTAVGDPIEVEAIASALSKNRNPTDKLPIGSIKGNVGHTESAAGLAGLIKAVLMLEKGCIPPQVNFEKANKKLLLDEWNLRELTWRQQIPLALEPRELRRISVNSFGYGGTNAHVILDTARYVLSIDKIRPAPSAPRPRAFVLSAGSEISLQLFAANLAAYVAELAARGTDERLLDRLCYTLNRRGVHRHRVVLVASNAKDLVQKLQDLSEMPVEPSPKHKSPRLAFIFGGQGAQYFNMGRELINVWPVFTASLHRANRHLSTLGCRWDVLEELNRTVQESRLDEPRYGQPLSTAIQLSLIDTLTSLGVQPSAVAGHSSGEIAAAYAAGLLSFEDAMSVSYHRGRLTSDLTARTTEKRGGMAALGVSSWVAEKYINSLGDDARKLTVACYNSPSSVTVSGDADAIEKLAEILATESVFHRQLRTNGAAYHSDWMRQIEKEYSEALSGISTWKPKPGVAMYSSLTGSQLVPSDLNKQYWVQNLVSPVLFEDAVWNMCEPEGDSPAIDFILEIGPHATLEGPIKQTIQSFQGPATAIKYIATLKRKTNAAEALISSVGRLFSEGFACDFHTANNGHDANLPVLLDDVPSYAFDHTQKYWHHTRLSDEYTNRKFLPHEILGTLCPDANSIEPRWRCYLDKNRVPWLMAHVIEGQVVFPAAGYLAMAIEALRRYRTADDPSRQINGYQLHKVSFGNALVIDPEAGGTEISLSLRPEARSARGSSALWMEFRVFTATADNNWTEHCRGLISPVEGSDALLQESDVQGEIQRAVNDSRENVNPRKFYFKSQDIGLQWQAPFDGVTSLKLGAETSICTISNAKVEHLASPQSKTPEYIIHPATLDAALFHGLCSMMVFNRDVKSATVPVFIQDLLVSGSHQASGSSVLTCYTTSADGPQTFDVLAQTTTGSETNLVFHGAGITVAVLPGDVHLGAAPRSLGHSVEWVTDCDALTDKRIQEFRAATVSAGSVLEMNAEVDVLVKHYVKQALSAVQGTEIPSGYKQDWFNWMQQYAGKGTETESPTTTTSAPSWEHLGVVGEAVFRIGSNLPDILRGATEPLELLSRDDLLTGLYSEERAQRCYAQMGAYICELSKQKPGLKIVEIGAGTGSASEPLLRALGTEGQAMVEKYDFTDISPVFFKAAKEKLADFRDIVGFKVCDLEREVSQQGFQPHSYDLVIACNVVHATRSITESLDRIHSLLKPGGKFLLMELTKVEPCYNLIFGSLPGWWAGSAEGRSLSPLLSKASWTSILKQQGFSVSRNSFQDYSEADGGLVDVIISQTAPSSGSSVAFPVEVIYEQSLEPQLPGLTQSLKPEIGNHLVALADLRTQGTPNVISVFPPELSDALAGSVNPDLFQSLKQRLLSSRAVLFLTRGATQPCRNPAGGVISGFARTLRLEHPAVRIITLDLDPRRTAQQCARIIAKVLNSASFDFLSSQNEVETEFSESEGQLYVPRVTCEESIDAYIRALNHESSPETLPFFDGDRALTARLDVPGLLDTLRWEDDNRPAELHPDEVQFELRAASINFKDVLIAAGQLEGTTEMKNDCSGIVTDVGANMVGRFKKGDRVCAYYSHSYSNRPRVHGDCVAIMPDKLTFEEGASLPIVWATVYYSLVDKGSLSPGESILIHSAAGAVGQASIILAQHLGAEVFVTVSSEEKKRFLMSTYNIPEDHIASSRSTAFGRTFRRMTGGKGVDVVLNSLGGDMFRESCNIVAPYGRFVEIGRKEFLEDMLMPSRFLLKNITFAYVDLALLIEDKKPLAKRILQDVIRLMDSGAVRPTSIINMPISEIESAFRLMQTGQQIGKVILSVQENQMAKVMPRPPAVASLAADGTYLVVGLGGISKAIVRWMAQRGARRIVAVSRSGIIGAAAVTLVEDLQAAGVEVVIKRCDVSSLAQVQTLVAEIGPIRGVVHSAMLLEDGLFANVTRDQWTAVQNPKIAGSWHLHSVLPHDLDFFVMLSSVVAVSGNAGQSIYGGACAYQDALAHFRRHRGLTAHSLNLGVVIDSGFVSDEPKVAASLRRQGFGTITTDQLLANLDYILVRGNGDAASKSQTLLGLVPRGNERGLREAEWIKDSKFRHLTNRQRGANKSGKGPSGSDTSLSIDLEGDIPGQICDAIIKQLGKLLAMPVTHLKQDRSLNEYGVDSLVAVELRNWIGVFLQANITLLTLRNTSIFEVAKHIAKDSRLVAA
ncbi:putative polyketide synthase [Microdochium trichocladiopsis]|uniref:Polyketide synthase n=1 Tax=Microdochium trichocladiopsis TaxID=1682393 RepID=A0A9P9BQ79_9PEZI|nr:putative polyketide synthase [Microdochium trichocladiopsis]KAH7025271.1 putative polyketide synthase [Microdochium trichocladiopsis]